MKYDKTKSTSEADLLQEIHALSEEVHRGITPLTTDFQKKTMIVQAHIEKLVVDFVKEQVPIKLLVMSLFYFWFMLDAPLHAEDPEAVDDDLAFDEMGNIIALIKKTTQDLPEPDLASALTALNKKMQQLRDKMPNPESLDTVDPADLPEKTIKVNTAIHQVTSNYIRQGYHPEIIANVMFGQWLRCSVFYGISEQEWQKMDYYFPKIIGAVREHLTTLVNVKP